MAKSELTDRLGRIAKSHGLNRKDYLEALLDFAEGQINHKQVKDTEFLVEVYFTPTTYKLFGAFKTLVLSGKSKSAALKELKQRYPRCTKQQFDATAKL